MTAFQSTIALMGPALMGICPKCTTLCQAPEHSYVCRSNLVAHLHTFERASGSILSNTGKRLIKKILEILRIPSDFSILPKLKQRNQVFGRLCHHSRFSIMRYHQGLRNVWLLQPHLAISHLPAHIASVPPLPRRLHIRLFSLARTQRPESSIHARR